MAISRLPSAAGRRSPALAKRSRAPGRGETGTVPRPLLAAALPDYCESAGVVQHRRHSNGHRDGPQLPDRSEDWDSGEHALIEDDPTENSTETSSSDESATAEADVPATAEPSAGVLRVSRLFAEEHRLDSGDIVHLNRLVKDALVLSRVVLVALTESAHRFATKKENMWRKRLWETGNVVVRGSVLRVKKETENDSVRRKGKQKVTADTETDEEGQSDQEEYSAIESGTTSTWEGYNVVDTRPLLQGVLDPERTMIAILPPTSKITPSSPNSSAKSDIAVSAGRTKLRSAESPLLLSSFILPSCRSFLSAPTASAIANSKKGTVLETEFTLQPLVAPEPVPSWRDEMTEVGLSLLTLRQLRIFSGSLVVLSNEESKKERLARAYALPANQEWAANRIYLSPILAFNLGLQQGAAVTIYEPQHSYTEARAVHISLVRSPASSLSTDYSVPLRRYFRSPRLLSLGDLVPVVLPPPRYPCFSRFHEDPEEDDSDDNFQEDDEAVEGHNNQGSVVYFKVTRGTRFLTALPDGSNFFRVSREETTLVQEGLANSAFPPTASSFLLKNGPETRKGEGWDEVEELMRACLEGPAIDMQLGCSILVHGPPANGKFSLARYLSMKLGIHLIMVDLYDLSLGGPSSEIVMGLQKAFHEAWTCHPSILYLRSLQALRSSGPSAVDTVGGIGKELAALAREYCDGKAGKLALLGSADRIDDIPAPIRAIFRHEINLPTPGVEVRLRQLSCLFQHTPLAPDVELSYVARKTASFVVRDLRALQAHAAAMALERAINRSSQNICSEMQQQEAVRAAGVVVTAEDIDAGIAKVSSHRATNIAAPNIPNVQWEDVGGLAHVKREILDTIQLPLNRPDLFSGDLRKRSGLLLYGPPGTGKTLVAKAVATECGLNFMSVKGPELINMYIGESEKNVRDTFQRARDARPCVIFFDELDSLAPARGAGADSGGVMDRIVSQLLTELDGIHKSSDVFVIGATNRPDLLEPALLRPGRFDRLLYLGMPDDHAQQLHIVKALTRKFRLSPSVQLEEIVQACPLNLTGADFYALCSEALQAAIRERILSASTTLSSSSSSSTSATASTPAEGTTGPVLVEQHHFMEALRTITPSVSPAELQRYRQLQQTFAQGRPSH